MLHAACHGHCWGVLQNHKPSNHPRFGEACRIHGISFLLGTLTSWRLFARGHPGYNNLVSILQAFGRGQAAEASLPKPWPRTRAVTTSAGAVDEGSEGQGADSEGAPGREGETVADSTDEKLKKR